jgi:hypothetical protein
MDNQPAKYTTDPTHTDNLLLRAQEMKLEAGVLGSFFGSTQRAASSIAWVMIFILVCAGVSVLFITCTVQPLEYWKTVSPLITLALGYLFGRRDK